MFPAGAGHARCAALGVDMYHLVHVSYLGCYSANSNGWRPIDEVAAVCTPEAFVTRPRNQISRQREAVVNTGWQNAIDAGVDGNVSLALLWKSARRWCANEGRFRSLALSG